MFWPQNNYCRVRNYWCHPHCLSLLLREGVVVPWSGEFQIWVHSSLPLWSLLPGSPRSSKGFARSMQIWSRFGGQWRCFLSCCRTFRGELTPVQRVSKWEPPESTQWQTDKPSAAYRDKIGQCSFSCLVRLYLLHIVCIHSNTFHMLPSGNPVIIHHGLQLDVSCRCSLEKVNWKQHCG